MIDINTCSFSIYGSYFSISKKENKLHIRDISNGDEQFGTLFVIDLDKYQIEDIVFDISKLTLISKLGTILITYASRNQILIKNDFLINLDFMPDKYEFANRLSNGKLLINLCSKRLKLLLVSDSKLHLDQEWYRISAKHLSVSLEPGLLSVHRSMNNFEPECFDISADFDASMLKIEDDFISFWKDDQNADTFLARYILWSSFVEASGILKYDACYMSKNTMTNIWSWDNCFVALGLARCQPQKAYEQFMSFAHLQSKQGNLPDYMNPYFASYDFTKPPIQGIIYQELIKINPSYFLDESRCCKVLAHSQKLLSYWLDYRRFNTDQLPYTIHGNDTGLDNASVFDSTGTMRTPDLFVYLIKLMELIEMLESHLHLPASIKSNDIDHLVNHLVDNHYVNNKFVSYAIEDGYIEADSKSIIEIMPLLVVSYFSQDIKEQLFKNFFEFVTPFGIATEATDSKFYEPNGYWRGPIWAPTTCLLWFAMNDANHKEQADYIASTYLELVNKHGLAENYNALTGQAQDDQSFAWSAAVYLFLTNVSSIS